MVRITLLGPAYNMIIRAVCSIVFHLALLATLDYRIRTHYLWTVLRSRLGSNFPTYALSLSVSGAYGLMLASVMFVHTSEYGKLCLLSPCAPQSIAEMDQLFNLACGLTILGYHVSPDILKSIERRWLDITAWSLPA